MFKLDKYKCKIEIKRNWFSNRVVDDWNRLNNHIVSTWILGSFKRRLDKFMDEDDRCK